MSTPVSSARRDATATSEPRPARRAYRVSEGAWVGGVCQGLARHLGVGVVPVQVFFVVASFFELLGVVLYGALWVVLPQEDAVARDAPGLEAATRQGRRPRRARRLRDVGPVVAGGALVLGLVWTVEIVLGGPALLTPAVLAVAGVALLWRQADEAQRARWLDPAGRLDLRRVVLGDGGPAAWVRLAVGVGLLTVALAVFAAQSGGLGIARDVVVATALGMIGLAVLLGPWLVRLGSDLSEERAERVRSQERADVAAHLHDSVLQTLALIQRNAGDAGTVARLARSQERELRDWMYGAPRNPERTVAAAIERAAAEVEDAHGVAVEVVTVGDAALDDAGRALVEAAREAMVNAAKHAGVGAVDVYAEAGPHGIEVFVRDRGRGFDPDAVAPDRQGVRGSILGRMARHGGQAQVRSAPGEGTEVRLRVDAPPPGASGGNPGSNPGSTSPTPPPGGTA